MRSGILAVLMAALLFGMPVDSPAQDRNGAADEKADRRKALKQLRQIAIGLHGYNDVTKSLPPAAILRRDGTPLLSWRVLLLPYVDYGGKKLFDEFKLDEPWDSLHNKTLLAKRPAVYVPVRKDPGNGATYYQVFTGKNTAFGLRNSVSVGSGFPDGTSLTFMVVEAAEPVPWTKPADLPYEADKPVPKLGAMFDDVFLFMTADATVHVGSRAAPEKELRLAIMPNDGRMNNIEKILARGSK